jgi:molybdopterin synthase sulfur carrier subunit
VRVEVRLFANLTAFLPPHSKDGVVEFEIPEGSTVADVTRRLGIPSDLARVVLVNGFDAGAEAPLAPRDVITIFPPLAGGSLSRTAPDRSRAAYASRGSVATEAASRSGSLAFSAAARSIAESSSAPTSSATPLQ